MQKFIAELTLLALVLSGCCNLTVSTKEALARRYPDFISKTEDFYPVSLDFWEKMKESEYNNELKIFEVDRDLSGNTDEARQVFAKQAEILKKGHKYFDRLFIEIRRRMDPNKDVLFHYAYRDQKDTTKSNEGILIVRNGKIRDKIILNGDGFWMPDETDSGK
jgi:hypothetical protein